LITLNDETVDGIQLIAERFARDVSYRPTARPETRSPP